MQLSKADVQVRVKVITIYVLVNFSCKLDIAKHSRRGKPDCGTAWIRWAKPTVKNAIPRGLDCVRKLAKTVHASKLESMAVNGMSWFLPPVFCCVFLPCLLSVMDH